ncbi:hypothetical protein T4C_9055, partial [Trichinella pseudospiralis]
LPDAEAQNKPNTQANHNNPKTQTNVLTTIEQNIHVQFCKHSDRIHSASLLIYCNFIFINSLHIYIYINIIVYIVGTVFVHMPSWLVKKIFLLKWLTKPMELKV